MKKSFIEIYGKFDTTTPFGIFIIALKIMYIVLTIPAIIFFAVTWILTFQFAIEQNITRFYKIAYHFMAVFWSLIISSGIISIIFQF